MAFNLVFLRAHNVLTQQRETNPSPLRVTMYKLLIHLEMMAFNYLNLVWGLNFPSNFNSKCSQAKTHIRAEIRDAGVSTWTSLKPGPPAIPQNECGSVVQLYLHKPNEREGEREKGREGEAGMGVGVGVERGQVLLFQPALTQFPNHEDFPLLDVGLLVRYRPLSWEQLYLVPQREEGSLWFLFGLWITLKYA